MNNWLNSRGMTEDKRYGNEATEKMRSNLDRMSDQKRKKESNVKQNRSRIA